MSAITVDASASNKPRETLQQRIARAPVICAEGYLFELERRGYVRPAPSCPKP